MRHAQVGDLAWGRLVTSSPATVIVAGVDRPQPDDGLDELRLAVALDAGDRDDLAGANVERHALDRDVVAVVADYDVVAG